jgi:two-component system, LytTR family, sensor kinase
MPLLADLRSSFPLRSRTAWAAFGGYWLVHSVVLATTSYYGRLVLGRSADLWSSLGSHLLDGSVMALGSLVALAAAGVLRLETTRWRRVLALHLALGLAVMAAQAMVLHAFVLLVGSVPQIPLGTRLQVAPTGLFIYAAWVGVGYAIVHHKLFRSRELQAAEREAHFARTRLHALRSQPHSSYLADALSAFGGVLRKNSADAGRALARLADFLRLSMESAGVDSVSLGEEVALLRAYFEVESSIRDDLVEVEFSIPPDLLEVAVPHPILQRLAEAVIDGRRGRNEAPLRVVVAADRLAGRMRLIVGVTGGSPAVTLNQRLARLEPLRSDLERVWGSDFTLKPLTDGVRGFRVALFLPLREVPSWNDASTPSMAPSPVTSISPPPTPLDPFRSRLTWVLLFGWWTLIGLVFSQMYYVNAAWNGNPISVGRALGIGFVDMYLWAAVCVAAFVVARTIPMNSSRWRRGLALHVGVGLAIVVGRLLLEVLIAANFGVIRPAPFAAKLLIQGPSHTFAYAFLVAVGYGMEFRRRAREKEISTWHLETQTVNAQLGVLKMQLHPHFLFNALNAIATLVRIDPAEAARTTSLVETLLRRSLARGENHLVSLDEELDLLRTYVSIEQVRQGDHLRVTWKIAPDVRSARVPHLVLQPLVENAIRHGISPLSRPGTLEISARRSGDELILQVRDDGAGFDANHPRQGARQGLGLSNTRGRLRCLYPGTERLVIHSVPGRGTTATVTIPFSAASQASGPGGPETSANPSPREDVWEFAH